MKNIKNADDYLAWIKSIITLCPEVVNLTIIREESQIDRGLWRYRVMLKDSSLLEMFEFFKIELDKVEIIKYSFHWQQENGEFIKRWDNAPHHPEIETYPHHVHDGAEDSVFPYLPVDIEEILKKVL
jgi:hypothetical protein